MPATEERLRTTFEDKIVWGKGNLDGGHDRGISNYAWAIVGDSRLRILGILNKMGGKKCVRYPELLEQGL